MIMLNRHMKTLLLVAEDDGERFYLRKQLLDLGYGTVLSSREVHAVPHVLSNQDIDLVILGADIDGSEVVTLLSDLRSADQPGDTALPAILMTESKPSPYLIEAIRIGINSCIIKPFTAQEFKARVDQICLYPTHFVDSSLADALAHRLEQLSRSSHPDRGDQETTISSKNIRSTQFSTAAPPNNSHPSKSGFRDHQPQRKQPPGKPTSKNFTSIDNMSTEETFLEDASLNDTFPEKKSRRDTRDRLPEKKTLPTKETLPVKNKSPTKDISPTRDTVPTKETLPVKNKTPTKDISPTRDTAPTKETPPTRSVASAQESAPIKDRLPTKDMPPAAPVIQKNQKIQTPSRSAIAETYFEEILAEHTAWLASNGQEGKRACFAQKKLQAVDFRKANLKNADFRHSDLCNANFEAATLEWADFRYAQLIAANLDHANATGIRLRHADCSLASLKKTILQDADLTGSIFKGAHLAYTDLTGSNLMEADFREVDLATVCGLLQHQFDKAIADLSTTRPMGILWIDPR